MIIKALLIAWVCLTAISFLLGLASPFFGGRATIWKGLGLWGLGLGAGCASVALSFYMMILQGQERAALRAAGKEVPFNDMPGFGQALLAAFGIMYFAAILTLIAVVFATSVIRHRLSHQRP